MPVSPAFISAVVARHHPRLIVAAASVAVLAATAAPAAAAPGAGDAAAAAQAPPSLFVWGGNPWGGLGIGTNADEEDAPIPVALPSAVRQISASVADTSAAVLANGTVATWGTNTAGQIGDGTTTERDSPFVVPGLTGITQVSVAFGHDLALDSAGTIWAWGDNYYGELGNGTTSQINGSNPTPVPVPGLTGVTRVAAGAGFSLALRSDGTVWAWGRNQHGELGDGTTVDHDRPERVPGLSGIKTIAAGAATSYAVRADGSLLAWGDNSDGLLGNGATTGMSAIPVLVPGPTGVTQVSSDLYGTLAVAGPAGTVWGWGHNYNGQLGDGTTAAHYTPEQTGLSGVSQIAAGRLVSVAALANGTVMTWSENTSGELGTGTKDGDLHPSPVLVRTLAGASQVAAGWEYALAVASPAPRVPSVIGYSQSDAAQVLQAAGYVLGRVAIVVDLTCEYLGEVKTQTPPAGTIDPPGTRVNVTIGKAGGKCL